MPATETIQPIQRETIMVPIKGTAPLIVSRFSEKAKRQILDTQQGRHGPKEHRDPEADYQRALYRMTPANGHDDRYGFPAVAFKCATVSTADFYGKEITMAGLRRAIAVVGTYGDIDRQALIEITGKPQMCEDTVRLAGIGRKADLRYRAEFPEWSTTLTIRYVSSVLSRATLLSLIDAGGTFIGVGEWRPERNGDRGTYAIDDTREVEVIV